MTTATENLFTATVYDFYGEEIETITGTDIRDLEQRVWSIIWSSSEKTTTYSISDALGAEVICGERCTSVQC
jgi:hypothetical protein